MQLLRENVEKSSLSKCIKVFNGLNIRCMIKVVKLVSYDQHFVLLFVCVEVLRPSQPSGVMSSAVSLPNHTFTGQA